MRLLLATLLLLLPLSAQAAELHWIVVSNYDGDTLRAAVSPNSPSFPVRIMGMDAPEISAKCSYEAKLAIRARELLKTLLGGNTTFEPHGRDRYGRVLAVVRVDGRDVAAVMIEAGLARAYAGGKRGSWCQ